MKSLPTTGAAALLLLTLGAAPLAAQKPNDLGDTLWYRKLTSLSPNGPALSNGDMFARAVANVGDLDGNGVVDLAVGAVGDGDGGLEKTGAIWILFLNADGSILSTQKISDTQGGFGGSLDTLDGFGRAIGVIGDLNGDGVPELASGVIRDDDAASDAGAVYVLFMNADGTVSQHHKISAASGQDFFDVAPQAVGGEFGSALAGLGDFDGDGIPDLAIGSRETDSVYVCYLNADGTVRASKRLTHGSNGLSDARIPGSSFGTSLANLGDVDGDGVVDLAVGGIDASLGPEGLTGAVWILFLDADGSVKSSSIITEGIGMGTELENNDEFGISVTGPGDLDGDGVRDLVVGSHHDDDHHPGDPQAGFWYGAVYVLFLNTDGTVKGLNKISDTVGHFIASFNASDRWGESLAPLGDFDGDGMLDLVVGTRFDDDGGEGRGAVYLLMLNDGTHIPARAFFGTSPTSGETPLTVTFTNTSSGDWSQALWDFGDGTTSSDAGASVDHTYQSAGTYTVSLAVSGTGGWHQRVRTDQVVVEDPIPMTAGFQSGPTTGSTPLTVSFTDTSFPDPTSWSWDFGDGGGSSAQHPVHTYAVPGTYSITLNVSGDAGDDALSSPGMIVVTPFVPPTADFSAQPTAGDAPLEVSFSDISSGSVNLWSWDFGDGFTSTETNPTHTFATPGTYTVTLTAGSAGGVDTETQTDLIVAATPAAPLAVLDAVPRSGSAPHLVAFEDLSSGHHDAVLWDFGDGTSSTEPSPLHVYAAPGTFDVTLTVSGLGGSDTLVDSGGITVSGSAAPVLADPSFEGQAVGSAPGLPWRVAGGAGAVVQPIGTPVRDFALPTEGSQWLEVSSAGTAWATPPSQPDWITQPSVGGRGVAQLVRFPAGDSTLVFDAAFLHGGAARDAADNDWMSVEVSDGTTTHNVYYADSFSGFDRVSRIRGVPMTPISEVRVDLLERFPDATDATDFLLSVRVGNGAADAGTSYGYVDDVRFETSDLSIRRFGCGENPVGSLSVISGEPVLGERMLFGIKNPLGTQAPGSLSFLAVGLGSPPSFCGSPGPGLGMDGGNGAILLDLAPPNPVIIIRGTNWDGPGTSARVPIIYPRLPVLQGLDVHFQGYLVDPSPTAAVASGLTDGVRVILR